MSENEPGGVKRQAEAGDAAAGAKRARVDVGGAVAAARAEAEAAEAERASWTCEARRALRFKLVTRAADVRDDGMWFAPEMTHQIYENEVIYGYRGLDVRIVRDARSLATCLEVSWDERRDDAQDVRAPLLERMGGYDLVTMAELEAGLAEPYEPPGREVTRSRCGEYVYRLAGLVADERMREFHRRAQLFVLFFIDASSYVDESDETWEVITVTRAADGALVGYATLYTFLAYPDRRRLRVSQVLVLPPHQRRGHGLRLLQAVFRVADERDSAQVNVEDPAPAFQVVRDLADTLRCHRLGLFGAGTPEPPAAWTDEAGTAAAAALRTTPEQVRRCYEALRLAHVDRGDAEAYKAYRIDVKRRLNKKHCVELTADYDTGAHRKQRLQEIYEGVERDYDRLIERLRRAVADGDHSN